MSRKGSPATLSAPHPRALHVGDALPEAGTALTRLVKVSSQSRAQVRAVQLSVPQPLGQLSAYRRGQTTRRVFLEGSVARAAVLLPHAGVVTFLKSFYSMS